MVCEGAVALDSTILKSASIILPEAGALLDLRHVTAWQLHWPVNQGHAKLRVETLPYAGYKINTRLCEARALDSWPQSDTETTYPEIGRGITHPQTQ